MSLPGAVKKLQRDRVVQIRSEPAYDGTGPRPSSVATPQRIIVRLAIQRDQARPVQLLRREDGDETDGQIRIWVTDAALAAAYLEGDVGKTPLGLTELPIAPPEKQNGPPGALIDYKSRTYELDQDLGWDEKLSGSGAAGFKRYRASEWAP